MTRQEKLLWKEWADGLRQEMMTSLQAEVAKSIETIVAELATITAEETLRSARFWRACQRGKGSNDFLVAAGFEIDFRQDDEGNVCDVTLRLNQTWMTILNRVLERQRALRAATGT